MAERDPYGWSGLTIEHLASLRDDEFEAFCFDLVNYETYGRHDDPSPPDGPAGRSVPDGGRDILLTTKRPPLISKQEYQRRHSSIALTEDYVGRTVYSCKCGKGWLDDARDDIQKKRKKPSRALKVLQEGGYFKLFINQIGKLDEERVRDGIERTPKEHLVHDFFQELKKQDATAQNPGDRIEIYDVHALVKFLQSHQPLSGAIVRWSDHFGLRSSLNSLEEWVRFHREDREGPTFVDDAVRQKVRDEMEVFLKNSIDKPAKPIAWFIGPPGVGKTRLLIETLQQHPAVAQRVRVAFNPEEAREALASRGNFFARHPDVVLIIDDCPWIDARDIAISFSAGTKEPAARLVVITPGGRELEKENQIERKWFLQPLESESAKVLAANVFDQGAEAPELRDLVKLGEGYPWFITLLAREMKMGQRAPRTPREAVQMALASRHEVASIDALEALQLRRARCLLAASLTRRTDWEQLVESEQMDLVRAVGLSHWQELKDAAVQCVKRGLLRRNLGWKYKYVTPLVVEREVIAWLFDPQGPGPGPKMLNRYAKDYVSDFYEAMEGLGLPLPLLGEIARHDFVELQSLPLEHDALLAAHMLGPRIRFIVRYAPEQAARELHRRVMATSVDDLRANKSERRDLVFIFDELASRRGTFALAEEALFKLGLAENEAYANNATYTWSQLFIPELNISYQSTEERIDKLLRRLEDPEPIARAFAISGAESVLTMHASRSAKTAFDGDRPTTSPHDAHHARVRVWNALARHLVDADAEVAKRAKKAAISHLRSSFWTGVGDEALELLADHAEAFDDSERIKLREVLLELRTYDTPKRNYVASALAKLEKSLVPSSYRERLRQHVGTWRPARLRKDNNDDEKIDDSLAHEGLAGNAPILGEIEWLLSTQAIRSHVFAFALGRQDENERLLEPLRARVRTSMGAWTPKIVLARYLAGMKESGRMSMADAILRKMVGVPEEAEVVALAVIELGATEERLAWIEAALQGDMLGAPCIGEIGRRPHWLSAMDDARFGQFLKTLLARNTVPCALAAVEQLVHAMKERQAATDMIKTLLLEAFAQLAGERLEIMPGHYWELGAKFLIRQGEAVRVAELAVRVIARREGPTEYAWNVLHDVAAQNPLAAWHAIASVLSTNTPEAGHLILSFMFHRSSFKWPQEQVLAWVGDDERRGRTVVSLVPRGAEELDPILRALVQRFGPHSSVANEIIARMHSTNGLVPSLAEHDARHLARARSWLTDTDPNVQELAKRLVESFTESHAHHAAVEEDERRRWGT